MENNNLELLNLKRLADFYTKAMNICLASISDFHKFKKVRTESNFKKAYQKMLDSQEYYQKCNRAKTLITKYLDKPDTFVHERAYSFKAYEIENELSKARNSSINDYTFIKTLELITDDELIESMKQLISYYLGCYKRVNSIKKEEAKTDTDTNIYKSNRVNYSIVYNILKKKMNSDTNYSLSEFDISLLKIILPDITTINGKFYSTETLNNGLAINNKVHNLEQTNKGTIINTSDSPLQMICNTATLVFDNTTLLLLSDTNNKDYNKIIQLLRIDKGIEEYVKAYNDYLTYYENLSRQSKEDTRIEFESNNFDEYRTKFGITNYHIINPQELVNRINLYIKSFITKKSTSYTDLSFNHDIYNQLVKCTSLMEANDLTQLYRSIFDNEIKSYSYCLNHGEELNIDINLLKTVHLKKMINLQEMFANLIATKISKIDSINSTFDTADLKQKDLLLAMICRDYFNEDVKFGIKVNPDELDNFRLAISDKERAKLRI